MSARFAARFGRDPAVLVRGAAGGGGLLAVRPIGRVDGAGGGTLRPVAWFVTGGVRELEIPPVISKEALSPGLPFATEGFGATGPFTTGLRAAVELLPVKETGAGRRAGAGGGAGGATGLGAGISSLR